MTQDDVEYGLDGEPIGTAPPVSPEERDAMVEELTAEIVETLKTDSHEDPIEIDEVPDVVEEPADYPEIEAKQLEHASVALECLRDLRHTISRQGVSQGDMQALGVLQSRLVENGFDLEPDVSLESYHLHSFTEERSGVNLMIAKESFGRAISNVIRAIISKLKEYINKLVRWARKAFFSEDRIKGNIEKARKRTEAIRKENDNLVRAYGEPEGYVEFLRENNLNLLTDPDFKPTGITLALLGVYDEGIEVLRDAKIKLPKDCKNLIHIVDIISEYLSSEDSTITVDTTAPSSIDTIRTRLGLVSLPSTTNLGDVQKKHPTFILQKPAARVAAEFVPYYYLVETYEKTNDALRSLNKIQDKEDVDDLVDLVNMYTKAADDLAFISRILYSVNTEIVKVLNAMFMYENKRFTLLFNYAKEKVMNTPREKAVNAVKDMLEKIIKESLK